MRNKTTLEKAIPCPKNICPDYFYYVCHAMVSSCSQDGAFWEIVEDHPKWGLSTALLELGVMCGAIPTDPEGNVLTENYEIVHINRDEYELRPKLAVP